MKKLQGVAVLGVLLAFLAAGFAGSAGAADKPNDMTIPSTRGMPDDWPNCEPPLVHVTSSRAGSEEWVTPAYEEATQERADRAACQRLPAKS